MDMKKVNMRELRLRTFEAIQIYLEKMENDLTGMHISAIFLMC